MVFTKAEKARLAKIGHEIGCRGLKDISCIVKPDTMKDMATEFVLSTFRTPRGARRSFFRTNASFARQMYDYHIEDIIAGARQQRHLTARSSSV